MKELTKEERNAINIVKNLLVTEKPNLWSDCKESDKEQSVSHTCEAASALLGEMLEVDTLHKAEKLLGEDYEDNMRELQLLFKPFADKVRELGYQLAIDHRQEYHLTAIPNRVVFYPTDKTSGTPCGPLLDASRALDEYPAADGITIAEDLLVSVLDESSRAWLAPEQEPAEG